MSKKHKRLPQKKFLEVVDKHEAETSGRTPHRVRAALLAGPREVCGVTLHPPALGTLIILEQIGHPVLAADKPSLTTTDALHLIFIFAQAEDAYAALRQGRDTFEAKAFAWANENVPLASIQPISQVAGELLAEAFSTIISSGQSQSEGEDTDPLARSRPQRPG